MKAVTINLPDEQAAALERAVADGGFASPSELMLAAIEDYLTASVGYDPEALARDVAEHASAKAGGDAGFTSQAARDWLAAARSE